jgi:ribosomal protein L11 methyltransferase
MSFVEVVFSALVEESEQIADLALIAGALAAEAKPVSDVFEEDWQNTSLGEEVEIILLFDQGSAWQEALAWIFKTMGLSFPYQSRFFADEDWIEKTKAAFEPFVIGPFCITPSWGAASPHAIPIVIDPGQAFGTGTHPTTRLCLAWLGMLDIQDKTLLDYGTGSGILAIAARKKGACPVFGVDSDPVAVKVAKENSVINQVEMACFLPEDLPLLQADIIVANILAKPLVELAPLFHALSHRGTKIALSGILARQAEEVITGFAPYFTVQTAAVEDGWVLITGERVD